ncbi:MAG TPA: vWA domain-containing protein [Candidatus Saccharimonadales bacterium]|jgi:Mg-chelatase subunit ChlD
MADKKFNPLDPKTAAPSGSFAAKLAARDARAKGESTEEALASVDVSELSDGERSQLIKNNNIQKAVDDFKFATVDQATERVCIVADDSSSMSGQKIADARAGITEFMRECVPNETAVKIHPINADTMYAAGNKILPYSCNLPQHAADVASLHASGSTPLYQAIEAELSEGVRPTRMIVFSDGEPDGYFNGLEQVIAKAKMAGIPLDTCFIANANYTKEQPAYVIMERLAVETGGIFIVFEKGKCSFKHGFKYLSKGKRLLLMDASFKSALESGRV